MATSCRMLSTLLAVSWLISSPSSAQTRRATPGARTAPPILDMHLHAREAAHYGATRLPLCAPVDRMPRWDQRYAPGEEPGAPPLCRTPLVSPETDAELLFCENETNPHAFGIPPEEGVFKDGLHDRIIGGWLDAVHT